MKIALRGPPAILPMARFSAKWIRVYTRPFRDVKM